MYFYQLCKRKPEQGEERCCWAACARCWGRTTTSTRISRRATIRGTSGSAWCPTPTSSAPSAHGKVSVVTDQIETFTETGIRLKSGAELEADIIVTATGLVLVPVGGAKLTVDGEPVDLAKTLHLQGHDVLATCRTSPSVFGYTNASWTLKADLVCEYVCRLLNHMDRKRLSPVHAAQRRSDLQRGAVGRLLLGLHPARAGAPAQAGLEAAVEALPELRARPAQPALRLGARRGDGVLAVMPALSCYCWQHCAPDRTGGGTGDRGDGARKSVLTVR